MRAKVKVKRKTWEAATWDGSRRLQLRVALSMTIRQRLQAMEELAVLAQRLAAMPRMSGRVAKKSAAVR